MGDGTEPDTRRKDIPNEIISGEEAIRRLITIKDAHFESITGLITIVDKLIEYVQRLMTYHFCVECKQFSPNDVYVQAGKPCVVCTQKRIETQAKVDIRR